MKCQSKRWTCESGDEKGCIAGEWNWRHQNKNGNKAMGLNDPIQKEKVVDAGHSG